MKNTALKVCTLLMLAVPLFAQAPADTALPKSPWSHSLMGMVSVTQVSFKDWAQGGENALSWTLSAEGKSERTGEVLDWSNSYKFAFGQARLGGLGLRKTDDKIDLESILTYKLGTFVNPYGAATLKSQFAEGYKYDAQGAITDTLSRFFDPAYLTQSVGFGYKPIKEVKTRLGAALREIITSRSTRYSDDPTTSKIEKTKVEGGVESVTDAQWGLMEDILLTVKLELFAPFKKFRQVVVRSDNTIAAKVNKYVSVNLNFQVIHEPLISPRTQFKETLALGLSYAFF